MRAVNRSGFTLVELMIVVVIIGILASMATIGYRKWISRARSSEAIAMLAEMNSKEQSYKLEFAAYLPLRTDNKPDLVPGHPALEMAQPMANDMADALSKWAGEWGRELGCRRHSSGCHRSHQRCPCHRPRHRWRRCRWPPKT